MFVYIVVCLFWGGWLARLVFVLLSGVVDWLLVCLFVWVRIAVCCALLLTCLFIGLVIAYLFAYCVGLWDFAVCCLVGVFVMLLLCWLFSCFVCLGCCACLFCLVLFVMF